MLAAHVAAHPTRVGEATSPSGVKSFNPRVMVTVLSHRPLTGAWITLFERLANPYELTSYFNDEC
jgi:hypothetical protein